MLQSNGGLPFDELVLLPKQIAGMRLPSVAISIDFNWTDMHGLHRSVVLIVQ